MTIIVLMQDLLNYRNPPKAQKCYSKKLEIVQNVLCSAFFLNDKSFIINGIKTAFSHRSIYIKRLYSFVISMCFDMEQFSIFNTF